MHIWGWLCLQAAAALLVEKAEQNSSVGFFRILLAKLFVCMQEITQT